MDVNENISFWMIGIYKPVMKNNYDIMWQINTPTRDDGYTVLNFVRIELLRT